MTLAEMEVYEKETLTPCQVAPLLQADPQTIRLQARLRPELLGFPVICMGNRVRIPRRPFLAYIKGEQA